MSSLHPLSHECKCPPWPGSMGHLSRALHNLACGLQQNQWAVSSFHRPYLVICSSNLVYTSPNGYHKHITASQYTERVNLSVMIFEVWSTFRVIIGIKFRWRLEWTNILSHPQLKFPQCIQLHPKHIKSVVSIAWLFIFAPAIPRSGNVPVDGLKSRLFSASEQYKSQAFLPAFRPGAIGTGAQGE